MHIVYRADTLVDAHLAKDYLEQAEIPAFIAGEYLIGGVGQLPARDLLTVSVPDTCIQAATPIIQDLEAMLAEARDAIEDSGPDLDADTGLIPSMT